MIDLQNEPLIPLAAATKLVPPARTGKRTHISTLVRWIVHGTRSYSGQVVRLEALRMGGRWMTSAAALERYAVALTPPLPADDPSSSSTPTTTTTPRTPTQRQRAAQRASEELDRLGI